MIKKRGHVQASQSFCFIYKWLEKFETFIRVAAYTIIIIIVVVVVYVQRKMYPIHNIINNNYSKFSTYMRMFSTYMRVYNFIWIRRCLSLGEFLGGPVFYYFFFTRPSPVLLLRCISISKHVCVCVYFFPLRLKRKIQIG